MIPNPKSPFPLEHDLEEAAYSTSTLAFTLGSRRGVLGFVCRIRDWIQFVSCTPRLTLPLQRACRCFSTGNSG